MKTAFIFPGQGAQAIGMGKYFIDNYQIARDTLDEASEYIGIDLYRMCFYGNDAELSRTENAQPALLAISTAITRVLDIEGIKCDYNAGLSLGEYTALVNSGAISYKDAIIAVRKRGQYMQEAVPIGSGAMAAIIGLERLVLENCLADSNIQEIVEIANYNAPGQYVISGETAGVGKAMNIALEAGAKRVIELSVSAPFHCSMMKPAAERLRYDLESIRVDDPKIPLITNCEARIVSDKNEIVPLLVRQVYSPVLWEDSIMLMINRGVCNFIEIGPGCTLSDMNKKIAKRINVQLQIFNTEDKESFEDIIEFYTHACREVKVNTIQ